MLGKLKEFVFGKDLVVYKLRKYLRKLYEGYPDHFFFGYERVHELQGGMSVLEHDKIIKREATRPDGVRGYRLTANGLKLVETWNTERLTFIVIILTLIEMLLLINSL